MSAVSGARPPANAAGAGVGAGAPPKYVKIEGVRQLNPAYTAYMERQGQPTSAPPKSLAVVTNMEDFEALQKVSDGPAALSKATDATLDMLQQPDVAGQIGLSPNATVDAVGAVCKKFEIHMGLWNMMMGLQDFDLLEFGVDDSGSMMGKSSPYATRWEEARQSLKRRIELLAHFPIPPIEIRFLNRNDLIRLEKKGETPERFIENAHREIDRVFARVPIQYDLTPTHRFLENSFRRGEGKKVVRYLGTDGVPYAGQPDREQAMKEEKKKVCSLVVGRENPEGNPIHLWSWSDEDSEVNWLKELEKDASNCSESDDHPTEAKEVARNQGKLFPYTRGFYEVGCLVGAMNPLLDNMDDCIPFSKADFDNLMGVVTTDGEYRAYFNSFLEAQRERRRERNQSPRDSYMNGYDWERSFYDLQTAKAGETLPAVREYMSAISAF